MKGRGLAATPFVFLWSDKKLHEKIRDVGVNMTTNVRCECGKFQAEVSNLESATPGRAICYCDDCQSFLHHLGRAELLDANGGSEIVPLYPSSIKFKAGREHLRCTQLSPKGLYRFSTKCCNTPVANFAANLPWVGMLACMFKTEDAGILDRSLGPVKSKIMAKFAYGSLPPDASMKLGLRDAVFVVPYLLKGFVFGKRMPSPFLEADGKTPIVTPEVISLEARKEIRKKISDRLGKQ